MEQEFREWLKRNRWLFDSHSIDEIAYLAYLAGFDRAVISHVLIDWGSVSRGMHPQRVAEFYLQHFVLSVEMLKPIRLTERWEDVAKYQQYGITWEE